MYANPTLQSRNTYAEQNAQSMQRLHSAPTRSAFVYSAPCVYKQRYARKQRIQQFKKIAKGIFVAAVIITAYAVAGTMDYNTHVEQHVQYMQ